MNSQNLTIHEHCPPRIKMIPQYSVVKMIMPYGPGLYVVRACPETQIILSIFLLNHLTSVH